MCNKNSNTNSIGLHQTGLSIKMDALSEICMPKKAMEFGEICKGSYGNIKFRPIIEQNISRYIHICWIELLQQDYSDSLG